MKSRLHAAQPNLRTLSPQRGELPRLFNRGPNHIAARGAGSSDNEKWMASAKPPLLLTLLLRLFADISQNTAVHIQNVAVYGVGRVGCEEHCGTCELVRL